MASIEGVLSWKRLSIILICLVVVQSLFLYASSSSGKFPRAPIFAPKQHVLHPTTPDHDLVDTLTEEQCAGEFWDLYSTIRKSAGYWKEAKHQITAEDVDAESWRADAAVRILIHDNELRIISTKGAYANDGYRMRTLSILTLLERAIWSATAAGERLPTIETSIVVDDMTNILDQEDKHTVWTWASTDSEAHRRQWLVPDFGFSYAPNTGSWTEARRRAAENDAPFIDKIPQAVWRGVTWTYPYIREGLINATANKQWADVKITDWKTKTNLMPMEFMCKYAFTIHTEGRSYSGRLGYLLNCDSLPIIHDLSWTGHFYPLLVDSGPNQNYVKVQNDWSDLEEKVQWYLEHPETAQKIIDNSIKTFRNASTTPMATSCYLRRLIEEFATVAYTPEVLRPQEKGEVAKRRGVSFDEFVHLKGDYRGDDMEET